MKVAATAPERIYLQVSDSAHHNDCTFPENHGDVTWSAESALTCEVEYVRADLLPSPVAEHAMIDRERAIAIAQAHAYAHHNDHAYLPATRDAARVWWPHEWAIDAIRSTSAGMTPLAQEVFAEINRATAKFPTWPTDPMHYVNLHWLERGKRRVGA